MRRIGVFALVVVAGCSAIFDMDDYDPRASDRGSSSSSSSSGATSSSGGSGVLDGGFDGGGGSIDGGSATSDAAADAGPPPCANESEPNDDDSQADTLVPGANCGVLSSAGDVDYFAFSTGANGTIEIQIPASVKFEAFKDGAASPSQIYQGGGGSASISAGSYLARVSHNGGSVVPAYKLIRK